VADSLGREANREAMNGYAKSDHMGLRIHVSRISKRRIWGLGGCTLFINLPTT